MKLIDWMLRTDPVHIVDVDGRTYATDRYVIVDCAYVDDKTLPVPGHYALRKNRAPVPSVRSDHRASNPAKLLAAAVEHFHDRPGDHDEVRWSAWVDHGCPDYPNRIGSLSGVPVATWHKVVSALPDGVGLVGDDPRKPLLIGRRAGSAWSFFGLVSTVRLIPDLDSVHDEIVAALMR